MKTLNEQYKSIKEGNGHKGVFLTEAKRQFPNYIRNASTFDEAALILKQKGIINENIVGIAPINSISSKKESYEVAFEKFMQEAKSPEIKAKEVKEKKIASQEETEKAELKKPSKQVEDDIKNIYDQTDMKNINNLIFGQVMKGYYAEMKDPKNADKTMEDLKDIVMKNLAKDPIHYTKDGQFGIKGVGYTTEHPGLGTPKEATGKYKASGYGDLKESKLSEYGPVDMDKYYPPIKNPGTKIIYNGKPGVIKGNFMMRGDEFATYEVNFDDGTYDEISTGDKNLTYPEDLEETLIRKAIRNILKEEIDEIMYQGISIGGKPSGGGGRRRAPETLTLSALAINRINTNGENALNWHQPHIIIGEDGNIKLSALLYTALESQERGRSSREKESTKSPLGRIIGEIDQESKNALRVIRQGVVRSIGADKYFNSIMPKSVGEPIMKTDRETGEQKELLGNIVIDNPGAKKPDMDDKESSVEEILREVLLRENIEKEITRINKEAEEETLGLKLGKINDAIEKRKSQLNRLDEDEDMKDLTDKKKVKELEKDIKKLEQAKAKIEKMMGKGKGKKKEVIDEMGGDEDDAITGRYEEEEGNKYSTPNMDDIESGNTYS